MEVAENAAEVDALDDPSLVHVDGGLYYKRVNVHFYVFDQRPLSGSHGSLSQAIIGAKGLVVYS